MGAHSGRHAGGQREGVLPPAGSEQVARGGPFGMSLALATGLLLATAGCSASRLVMIDSQPPGASIYVDGETQGITPDAVLLDFSGDRSRRIVVQLVKERYKPIFQTWLIEEVPETTKVFVLEAD